MGRSPFMLRRTDVTSSLLSVGRLWGRGAWTVLLLLLVAAGAIAPSSAELKKQPLTFVTGAGERAITVEVADNESTRATGLMFRRSLGPDEGMIFVYDKEDEIAMWMKNTYISLDMIFVRKTGVISHIHTNAEPFSEAIIPSQGPAFAVIEMAAGSAARLGLKTGDRVKHPAFK